MFVTRLALAFLVAGCSHPAAVELMVRSPIGHDLAGVLETPDAASALPTVVLIGGAGPDDRNSYTVATSDAHNDAFRTISRRVQGLGFAVLRFDEVGTGASTGDYSRVATTESLARDVAALVATLRRRPEVDPNRIILLGYSEGGVIAAMVARRDPRLAGIVLAAAPSWTADRIMQFQDSVALAVYSELPDPDRTAAQVRETDAREREAARRQTSEEWYPFFLRFDPLPEYRGIRAPVLILQGELDRRVAPAQADEIVAALRAGGTKRITVHRFPGLGHAFIEDEWGRVPKPISERVLQAIEDWLTQTAFRGR